MTIRYGLTSNLSLDFTANPDFSQVEADVDAEVLASRLNRGLSRIRSSAWLARCV